MNLFLLSFMACILKEKTNPSNKKLIFNKDETCLNEQM